MASSSAILSPSIPLQLCLWKSEKALVMKPRWARNGERKGKGMRITCQAMTAPIDDRVPDMGKRQLMNLILLGTISLPIAGMVVPYGGVCYMGLARTGWVIVPIWYLGRKMEDGTHLSR
nr:cytochrome b6-f complex iron-sulfur subunit, chloroplastic-like [Ziziphus jujuba var. spinosa]